MRDSSYGMNMKLIMPKNASAGNRRNGEPSQIDGDNNISNMPRYIGLRVTLNGPERIMVAARAVGQMGLLNRLNSAHAHSITTKPAPAKMLPTSGLDQNVKCRTGTVQ